MTRKYVFIISLFLLAGSRPSEAQELQKKYQFFGSVDHQFTGNIGDTAHDLSQDIKSFIISEGGTPSTEEKNEGGIGGRIGVRVFSPNDNSVSYGVSLGILNGPNTM